MTLTTVTVVCEAASGSDSARACSDDCMYGRRAMCYEAPGRSWSGGVCWREGPATITPGIPPALASQGQFSPPVDTTHHYTPDPIINDQADTNLATFILPLKSLCFSFSFYVLVSLLINYKLK